MVQFIGILRKKSLRNVPVENVLSVSVVV